MILQSLLVDVCTIWIFKRGWLVFETYDYWVMIGWYLEYMIIELWLVDICNIWLLSHGWLVFRTYNYSIMVGVVYVAGVLFAFLVLTIMNFFFSFHRGVQGIWIWSIWHLALEILLHCIALHCITWHSESCREPMVATVPVQHSLLIITMQLHTLLGMKVGVHMHPYAYIIGLA